MGAETLPDGRILEFPDGTPPEFIATYKKSLFGPETPPAPPAPAPNMPAPVAAAMQGATLGVGDELSAGLSGVKQSAKDLVTGGGSQNPISDFSNTYDAQLGSERKQLKEFSGAHPVLSTGLEIAGGLPTGLGTLVAGKKVLTAIAPGMMTSLQANAPKLYRNLANIFGGAALGGATGAGTTEDDKRVEGAVEGATTGAVLGAVIPPVLSAAGIVAGPAFNALMRALGFSTSNKLAQKKVLEALEKDGITPEDALKRIDELKGTSTPGVEKPVTLLDVSGENTQELTKRAGQVAGPGRTKLGEKLEERQANQASRLIDDVRGLISTGGDYYGEAQKLIAKRSNESAPLYEAAWKTPFAYIPGKYPILDKIIERPSMQGALKKAVDLAKEKDLDIGDPTQSIQGLHYVKLALDDAITAVKRESGYGSTTLKGIVETKKELTRFLDKYGGTYAEAREKFAGPSALIDAMDEGKRIFKMHPDETRAAFKDLSQGEKDAFRSGVASSITDMVSSAADGSDVVKKLFGNKMKREQLRVIFDNPKVFEEFEKRMTTESLLSNTNKKVLGSKSPINDAAVEADASKSGIIANIIRGRPGWAMASGLNSLVNYFKGINPETSGHIIDDVISPSGPKTKKILGALSEIRDLDAAKRRWSEPAKRGAMATMGEMSGLRDPVIREEAQGGR